MYYILKFNVENSDYYAEKMDIGNLNSTDLLDGIRINPTELKISLSGTRGTVADYIGNVYGLDIVSEDIRDLFVEFGEDFVECYPVTPKRKTDKTFWFIHVLDNVDCFDFEKSVYEEYGSGTKVISKIDKLVLNEHCDSRHFFRIKDFDFEIVVSEAFKQAAESRNFEVMKFIPVADFKFDPTKFDL